MNSDGTFRELTPEDAEAAYADAPEAEISDEDMARLTRKTFILIGAVPVAEMTDDELWWLISHSLRHGRSRR